MFVYLGYVSETYNHFVRVTWNNLFFVWPEAKLTRKYIMTGLTDKIIHKRDILLWQKTSLFNFHCIKLRSTRDFGTYRTDDVLTTTSEACHVSNQTGVGDLVEEFLVIHRSQPCMFLFSTRKPYEKKSGEVEIYFVMCVSKYVLSVSVFFGMGSSQFLLEEHACFLTFGWDLKAAWFLLFWFFSRWAVPQNSHYVLLSLSRHDF